MCTHNWSGSPKYEMIVPLNLPAKTCDPTKKKHVIPMEPAAVAFQNNIDYWAFGPFDLICKFRNTCRLIYRFLILKKVYEVL